jgi:hypothetical protein
MKPIQKIVYAGFATAALASASLPAVSGAVSPDVDFEWYANVGKPMAGVTQSYPAPREGYIWSPGHYEYDGQRQVWVRGHWIRDDYAQQVTLYATGSTALRDSEGNVIPTDPSAYPVDSARR